MSDALKRIMDLLVCGIALMVLWPLLVAIAIAVKLTSPGPVLYKGLRTGQFGRPFRILKFRSMVPNGELCGGTTTGENDPRITAIGHWLRRYKLDELPQLINVLSGEMSLVGPRPEVPEYTDAYTPTERRILDRKPGITDLASLEFSDLQRWVGSGDPDRVYREQVLPRKNQLRLRYAEEHSLWLDLTILARTILVVAMRPFRSASRGEVSEPLHSDSRRAA